MNKGLLTGGEPQEPAHNPLQDEIESLRLQVRGLKQELREAMEALEAAKQQSASAVKALRFFRVKFEPYYTAMRLIFGELDAANIPSEYEPERIHITNEMPGAEVHRKFAYWETWEKKLGGKAGEIIRALLDHGRLNRTQVREAISAGWTSTDEGIRKLKGLDLIEKNGDYWSLKEKV